MGDLLGTSARCTKCESANGQISYCRSHDTCRRCVRNSTYEIFVDEYKLTTFCRYSFLGMNCMYTRRESKKVSQY